MTTTTEEYLGLTEHEAFAKAKRAGIRIRTSERDGEPQTLTADDDDKRLNLVLEAGLVVRVHFG